MRTAKILSLGVGGLIGLLVMALLAIWLLVNPNEFKPKLAAAVKSATGRELSLSGDLKLSVFPWVALEMGPASLGNPAGFPEQPFLSFGHATVRVKLLPLLGKRLAVGRVELAGLNVRLLRNAAGRGNWQDFGHAQAPVEPAGRAASGASFESIAGVKISGARVSYDGITVDDINLETGSFTAQGEVPVSLHLHASREALGERAARAGPGGAFWEQVTLDAQFDVSADLAARRGRVVALNLNSVVALAGNPRPVRCSVSIPGVDADLVAQTLSAPAFAVNLAGAQVTGTLAASQVAAAPMVTGSVALAPLVVREYLPRMGVALPRTRDPKALSLVSGSGYFTYGGAALRLEKLLLTLDDTQVEGGVALNLDSRAVNFDVAVGRIDADRYLAPEVPPGSAAAAGAVSAPASGAGGTVTAPASGAAEAGGGAASPAQPWDINGSLALAAVHLAPLDLSAVKLTVASHDAVMRLFPLTAQLDGGRYSGDITVDYRLGLPVLFLDEHVSGIEVGKLVAGNTRNVHVTGRGSVNLKATARGAGVDALLRSLSGHLDASVADGAVEGVDLGYEIGRAEALLRRQDASAVRNSRRTPFGSFKMSAQIADGVARTNDLTIASNLIKITGQGSANLPAKTLDVELLADTLRTVGAANTPLRIPVRVTGSMSDPSVRPDVAALAKGQIKQKLEEVLQDKLKGLFGRP